MCSYTMYQHGMRVSGMFCRYGSNASLTPAARAVLGVAVAVSCLFFCSIFSLLDSPNVFIQCVLSAYKNGSRSFLFGCFFSLALMVLHHTVAAVVGGVHTKVI